MNIPRWFILTCGSVALALWVAAFFATILIPGYKADPIIGYGAMMVVAACFGSDAAKRVIEKAKEKLRTGTGENAGTTNAKPVDEPNPGRSGDPSGAIGVPPRME